MIRLRNITFLLVFIMLIPSISFSGEMIKRVRSKGVLRCGVSEGLPGFSMKDARGQWTGMDADFCRAVAAAVFGDSKKVDFVSLTAAERFPALRNNSIDLLARNTTWTIGREAGLGVQFVGTLYYDGQGFLVRKGGGVTKFSDLKNATICIEKGTTSQANLDDYFRSKGWKYKPIIFESLIKAQEAFFSGQCTSYTSDRSHLAAVRSGIRDGSKTYTILPGQISKEPLGPVVRRGDEDWFTLVRWVLFALIEAEEIGVTQANVRAKVKEKGDPDLERFLGSSGNFGKTLGISNDWTVRIVESVGNYGEMFERNLGRGSPLKLDRGPNRLWNKGGLMYAPPFR
jgi:general L-amino acid transport system substrate-binding protein